MIGLSFNQLFENKLHYEHHLKKIASARPAIDDSKPKSKLKCTKQPLSQFHRTYQKQLENKHLYSKITHPESSIKNHNQNRKLIKNNRKKYYEQYEKHLENTGLLKRIFSAKTSYNLKRFMAQRKQQEQYLQTISKFGYKQKKTIPFHFKCKTLPQDLQLFEEFPSNQVSKQKTHNSQLSTRFPSQVNDFRSFKDSPNKTRKREMEQAISRK